ncbi:MAG: preprotein translocase subunit SecE [Candidatus Promineifilaceae bacterium]
MAQTKTESKGAKKAVNQPNPISKYIRETRGELRKVTWPTREESQRLTAIVLGVTVVMAIFLGVLDFIFSNGIQAFVQFVIGT